MAGGGIAKDGLCEAEVDHCVSGIRVVVVVHVMFVVGGILEVGVGR